MKQDTRDELVAAQLDWEAAIAEKRKRRQDIVMRALAEGNTKYAIAKVLGVAGPTVDSIVKTVERERAPARPVPAERPEPETAPAGPVPFREPEPEDPAPKRKNCTHPGVVKGVCHAPGCGEWVSPKR